jgi:ASC-1-like (ASCH) protein
LPSFLAKKEIFEWLKQGKKTIDVRKGNPQNGGNVLFVCGPYRLAMRIVGTQSGRLTDVIRQDNFRQVIPSAQSVDDALAYLRRIYGDCDGIFTAYTVTC